MSEPIPVPTYCRLELWNPTEERWGLAHAQVALLHPRRYIERLADKGKVGRVTLLDTGEVLYGEDLATLL